MIRGRWEVVLAAGCALAGSIEVLARVETDRGVQLAAVAATALGVLLLRRAPLAAVAVEAATFTTLNASGLHIEPTGAVVAFVAVLAIAAERLPLRPALAALAMCLVSVIVEALVLVPFDEVLWVFFVLLLPSWSAGRLLRDRRLRIAALEALHAELEAEQERTAALAAEAERARIAREMHDALSHGVGLMTLQAGAGSRLEDPEAARTALRAIAAAGRSALEELDGLLDAPEDGVPERDLEGLIDGVRASGLQVGFTRETDAAPPAPVALAVHRILQEALTNAVKHAAPCSVQVHVREAADAVEVRVQDDGGGNGAGGGSGRGLIGMRERARLYGGEVEAGSVPGGGFRVAARIPLP